MCKNLKAGNFITIIWHFICHNWSSIDFSMAPQRCKVPISIVAVNHTEVIDHIGSLHNELNIYGGGFEPLISSCVDHSYLIQFFYPLIWFAKVRKWSGGYCYTYNVQFEDVSFFIKVSDEEKFLLFQRGEIKSKWALVSYWYAWCRNED